MDLPKEENDKFRIKKRDDGDVLIFRNNAEGEQEPLIHAKRDRWFGIKPMDDLTDLWYLSKHILYEFAGTHRFVFPVLYSVCGLHMQVWT